MSTLLILSFSRLERDPRVQRQIALFAPRHRVTTVGFGPAPHPDVEHVELPEGTRAWPSSKQYLLTRRYRHAYWDMSAVRAAAALLADRVGECDAVLANDVNSLPLALWLAPRRGVHADLHEFSPREKEHDPIWRLAVAPFFRWICRSCLPRVHSVTTVSPGLAEAYAADYGVQVEVVMNTPDFAPRTPRPTGAPIRLLHTGAARSNRRLEHVIDAMRGIENATLDLMLVESEPGVIEELRRRAGDSDRIRFREVVPYQQLVDTIAEYDASIVFFPPTTFNLRHTLPNKLFEAVQARGGLIVSPSPDMAELVARHELGAIAEDFTADALHRVLAELRPDEVDAWKRAADRAAAELSAEHQVQTWGRAIEVLLGAPGVGAREDGGGR